LKICLSQTNAATGILQVSDDGSPAVQQATTRS